MKVSVKTAMCYIIYSYFAKYLPGSEQGRIGRVCCKFRYSLCKHIFEYCGQNVTIERKVSFGYGYRIRIGDNSGMGANAVIPDGTHIGDNVMMGPNCYIHVRNHAFSKTDIPIIKQGYQEYKYTKIGNDVWIGRDVSIMAGRTIADGCVVAANCVLTKDFPPYSIIGGNPSVLIKSRLQ